ncbi:MAG: hypothetical protein SYR96_07220, partial [Actinomycetota bacterium]|nr:hypothetical protein [Actinomycetota bacterium]
QPREVSEQHDQPLHRGEEPDAAPPAATEQASGGGALPSPEPGFLQRLDQRPGLTAAGTAFIAVPVAPSSADGYFWGEDLASGKNAIEPYPGLDDAVACLKGNSAALRDFLAADAELSPEMAEAKADIRT